MNSTVIKWALIVAIPLFILYLLSGLLVYTPSTAYPWRIQPQDGSINYTVNGTYKTTFGNGVAGPIEIQSISLNESLKGVPCDLTSVSRKSLMPGETFSVQANCPKRNPGEGFDVLVEIKYKTPAGGGSAFHTEQGHIRGQVDAAH